MKRCIMLSTCALLLVGCNQQNTQSSNTSNKNDHAKVTLTLSAAASLKDALTKIESNFEQTHPNIDVKINYGASGALSQQIKSGAPVDLFFSAAEDKVDQLIEHQDIEKQNSIKLLKNHLVLIANKPVKNLKSLNQADIQKIAIGQPKVVPAGQYATAALTKAGLFKPLKDKFIYTKDVRQVLTYVETKNVDAGIVYASDLKSTNEIKYHYNIEDALHDDIVYPLALIKSSKHPKEAKAFYQYLQSKESLKIYESYGFDTK